MVGVANKTPDSRSAMLEEITIRGIGVIEEASVDFSPGFNVITGETGAGKTMLLTALSLVLGGKGDPQLVREQQDRLVATARFSLGPEAKPRISEMIEEIGASLDENSLLFSRSMTREGKSRASLGGVACTASNLQSIGSEMIAVHGQHASLSLSKSSKQRELLDAFAGESLKQVLTRYVEELSTYRELKERIRELRSAIESRDKEIAELEELSKAFEKLNPKKGELEELNLAIARLESVEELRAAAEPASQALDAEDAGALTILNQAKRFLANARGKDPLLDDVADEIQSALYTLTDASSALVKYIDSLEADPQALEFHHQRKAALSSFSKKYAAGDYEAAVILGAMSSSRIHDLKGGDSVILELEQELTAKFNALKKIAVQISGKRSEAASELSRAITKELASLAMPGAKFSIHMTSSEIEDDSVLREYGVDEIEMLFTSHGEKMLPIAKAASGGELSRLLLAIEVSIAGRQQQSSYVFDEVDAGIGGKAALEVGKRLRMLAEKAQVIVVTHLPQVAIWADRHIVVSKSETGSVTTSSLSKVDGVDRETEIARMLSGLEESEHAQEHARELLRLRKEQFA